MLKIPEKILFESIPVQDSIFKRIFIESIFFNDPALRCKACAETFYFGGCPSCGNEFISRREQRQTF